MKKILLSIALINLATIPILFGKTSKIDVTFFSDLGDCNITPTYGGRILNPPSSTFTLTKRTNKSLFNKIKNIHKKTIKSKWITQKKPEFYSDKVIFIKIFNTNNTIDSFYFDSTIILYKNDKKYLSKKTIILFLEIRKHVHLKCVEEQLIAIDNWLKESELPITEENRLMAIISKNLDCSLFNNNIGFATDMSLYEFRCPYFRTMSDFFEHDEIIKLHFKYIQYDTKLGL